MQRKDAVFRRSFFDLREVVRRPEWLAWRKGWDSNPRVSCPTAGFQDRCLQPLGHPSSAVDICTEQAKKKRCGDHLVGRDRTVRGRLAWPFGSAGGDGLIVCRLDARHRATLACVGMRDALRSIDATIAYVSVCISSTRCLFIPPIPYHQLSKVSPWRVNRTRSSSPISTRPEAVRFGSMERPCTWAT